LSFPALSGRIAALPQDCFNLRDLLAHFSELGGVGELARSFLKAQVKLFFLQLAETAFISSFFCARISCAFAMTAIP
jgi:hypothetical protein